MTTKSHQNYRFILQREFEARTSRNSKYSLRAFARDLGISSARLSEILGRKQGLSVRWAARIADRLGYESEEKQRFCDLIEIEHGRSKVKRRCAELRLAQALKPSHRTLELDTFQVISDWHHFAITELTQTRGFRSDNAWIAKKLAIHKTTATDAVERLLRLGLLVRDERGRLHADPALVATPSGTPSEAIRKFHSQILQKAAQAIYTQGVHQRDLSAILLPMDRSQLPQARKLIQEFRRGFSKSLGPMPSKDSVYCLSIQFFQLDHDLPEEK